MYHLKFLSPEYRGFFVLFSVSHINFYYICNMKNIIFLIIICTGFSGCEKVINFNLKSSQPTLVVEGMIENGMPPKVIISKNI